MWPRVTEVTSAVRERMDGTLGATLIICAWGRPRSCHASAMRTHLSRSYGQAVAAAFFMAASASAKQSYPSLMVWLLRRNVTTLRNDQSVQIRPQRSRRDRLGAIPPQVSMRPDQLASCAWLMKTLRQLREQCHRRWHAYLRSWAGEARGRSLSQGG